MLEHLIANTWNRFAAPRKNTSADHSGIVLGHVVVDEQVSNRTLRLRTDDRVKHTVTIGLTGHGKTTAIEYQCSQDIEQATGFATADFHDDSFPRLLGFFAYLERQK